MRKTLKGAGAAALAAATVVSGLSFGSAAASAAPKAPKAQTAATEQVKLVWQTGANSFIVSTPQTQSGNHYFRYGTSSTLATALSGAFTYDVERRSDGWFQLRRSGSTSCLSSFTFGNASEPALTSNSGTSCGATATQWRLNGGKLENRAAGFVGKTFTHTATVENGWWNDIGFTGNTGGWQLASDVSPLNPVTNGGVTAASNPDTTLTRGASIAVPFAMRATATYNKVNSSTVTFTAPENTVFTPNQTVRGQWRATPSSAWNLQANLNLTNVSITNNGKTLTGNFASPSSFEQGTNHELGWLPMVTANADSAAGQGTLTAAATGSTNLGNFTVNGSTKTTIAAANGGIDAGGIGFPTTIDSGEQDEVHFGAAVTGSVNSMTDAEITVDAPAGSTFPADQTALTGEYWTSATDSWSSSSSLRLNGSVSSDGTKFTGTIADNTSVRLSAGNQVRWGITVEAGSSARTQDLAFSATGTTNAGTFSFAGNSAVTVNVPVENGGFNAAGIGAAATVKQGEQTEVRFGLGADAKTTLNGATQITLTAPAGTSFPADLKSLTSQYKTPSGAWVASPNITVTGSVSADGKTFTGTIPADAPEATFQAGSEGRWTAKLDAAKDATIGTRDLGFTISGTTTLGAFSVEGNSPITVAKSDGVDLTARGAFDADVTKLATISGTAQAGASVKLHDADGKVIDTVTASADNSYSFDVPAPKTGGVHRFSVTQTPTGGTESAHVNVELDYGQNTGLQVTSPVNGSTITDTVPTFVGNGQSGAKVDVRGTTRTIGSGSVVDGKWTFPAEFALQVNRYAVEAVQTTKGGLQTTTEFTFTIAKKDQTVALTAKASFDADDALKPAIVTGAATPGATVSLKDSLGNVVATATANADAKYTLTIPPTAATPGVNDFTVTQRIGGVDRDSVSVSLDYGTPKPVNITSPVNGSTVDKNGLTFTGTGDDGARVEIRGTVRAIAAGSVSSGTWTAPVTVDLTNNVYNLWAVQTTKGGLTTKQAITVTIVDQAMAPLTATAAFNAQDENLPASISGNAQIDATVTVKDAKGEVIGTTKATGGKYSIVIPPAKATFGINTFTVTQTANGKESEPITRSLDYGNPVAPTITSPSNNATVATGKVTFTGTGASGAKIDVRGMVSAIGTGSVANGAWTVETRELTPNSYRLFAVQTSKGGLTKQVETIVNVKEKQVTELTAAGSFAAAVDQEAIISGNAQTGATVVVREGNTVISSKTAVDGKYSITIPAGASGLREFTVTQTVDGVVSAPKPASLDYGTVTPVAVESPTEGQVVKGGTVTFTGSGTPGAKVLVNGTANQLGSATVNGEGDWSVTLNRTLTPQVYTLFVKQTTKGNLVGDALERTFTVLS